MLEQLVHEHRSDLLRAAAVARRAGTRAASRVDLARPRLSERAARWVRTGLLHRPAVARGCQA